MDNDASCNNCIRYSYISATITIDHSFYFMETRSLIFSSLIMIDVTLYVSALPSYIIHVVTFIPNAVNGKGSFNVPACISCTSIIFSGLISP